jgi:putative toxin-antitoxin system antitoxin component (TIGR02293 family)
MASLRSRAKTASSAFPPVPGDLQRESLPPQPTGRLNATEAVESIISRAIEVIGDRDQAMRWLGTPVRALDFATPISLLGTGAGAARVEDVLGQMEHGIW